MGKSASGKDRIYSVLAGDRELNFRKLILYTTRPIRAGEENGVQYYFTDENKRKEFQEKGLLIESRSYDTVHGVWSYFTADDGQINLDKGNYLGIGTLESYHKMKEYFGEDCVVPLYIQVEDGERLERAIKENGNRQTPGMRSCADVFWQIRRIFRKIRSEMQGLTGVSRMIIWIIVSEIL